MVTHFTSTRACITTAGITPCIATAELSTDTDPMGIRETRPRVRLPEMAMSAAPCHPIIGKGLPMGNTTAIPSQVSILGLKTRFRIGFLAPRREAFVTTHGLMSKSEIEDEGPVFPTIDRAASPSSTLSVTFEGESWLSPLKVPVRPDKAEEWPQLCRPTPGNSHLCTDHQTAYIISATLPNFLLFFFLLHTYLD